MISKIFAIKMKRQRGFSLVETAIVLAVVASVLGGVWSVATVMQKKTRNQRAYEDTRIIVENMQSVGMGMAGLSTWGIIGSNITTDASNAKVFPAGTSSNPWDSTYQLFSTAETSFEVRINRIPPNECIRLNSRFLDDTNLLRVFANGDWVTRANAQSAANLVCQADPNNAGKVRARLEFALRSQKP